MKKQNYEVEVLINGNPIKEYHKDSKTYVEGRRGAKFSIRIKNNGSKRIVATPSVDGLSVMDGKNASKDSQGYIISGYDSLVVDGWRISDKEVKEFFFTNPGNSYAERKGKGKNLGVIGVAVFREREIEKVISDFLLDDRYWSKAIKAHNKLTPRGYDIKLKQRQLGPTQSEA